MASAKYDEVLLTFLYLTLMLFFFQVYKSITQLERHIPLCSKKDKIAAQAKKTKEKEIAKEDPDEPHDPNKHMCIYCCKYLTYLGKEFGNNWSLFHHYIWPYLSIPDLKLHTICYFMVDIFIKLFFLLPFSDLMISLL